MNGADGALMSGVKRLQQVERFRTSNFADENAIRPMPQRRPQKIGNRYRRQWCLLAEWLLGPSRFKSHEVWLVDLNLRRLFDQHDAITWIESRSERV